MIRFQNNHQNYSGEDPVLKQKNIVLLTVLALFGVLVLIGGGCGGSSSSPAAPAFTSVGYTSVKFGVGGAFQVEATGAQPITFSLTGEPAGVTIDASSGLMTIDATVPEGAHDFTITASTSTLIDITQKFTLYVKAEYQVGNTYPHGAAPSEIKGVVVSVSNGGIDGKIISLDETTVSWAAAITLDIPTGAIDTEDGQWNTDVIVAIGDLANFPAFDWCVNIKGSGWYLPAINELNQIISNISETDLNAALLPITGSDPIATGNTNLYWSSTEQAFSTANSFWFGVGSGGGINPADTITIPRRVRAFKAF